jgi:hypothetical protein
VDDGNATDISHAPIRNHDMRSITFTLLVLLAFVSLRLVAQTPAAAVDGTEKPFTLWYRGPALRWTEASVIGGRYVNHGILGWNLVARAQYEGYYGRKNSMANPLSSYAPNCFDNVSVTP